MAVKILARAGISLAGIYDVKGSQAPVELLEAGEVTVVHEMGATIFSERFSIVTRKFTTAALSQNTDFGLVMDDLPRVPFRILNIAMVSLVTARTERAQVSLRDVNSEREIPMAVWNRVDDVERSFLFVNDGAAAAAASYLSTAVPFVATMAAGRGQPQFVGDLSFRGRTAGFGAGTVVHIALIQIGFSQIAGLSSFGLPIPSW